MRDLAEHDVAVRRDAVTQLQRVDLVVVAEPSATQIEAAVIGEVSAHALAPAQGGRHHVHLQHVGPAVVVEIGDIDAHPGDTRVLDRRGGPVAERAIPVVDVEDVIGRDVVGNVNVGPPIPVHVGHHHAQPVPDLPQDPRLARDIREAARAVVAIEGVPAFRAGAADAEGVRVGGAAGKVLGGIVEQEEVEAAVAVVVEEDGVGGVAGVGDAEAGRGFGERAIAVIDEQQVGPVFPLGRLWPGDGDVDIQISVVVDVHHGRAGGPAGRRDPGRRRDVLEPHVPFVPVQPARDHVAREENVGQAVVIDVPDRHARAVVDVGVGLHVEGIIGRDRVRERDTRSHRGEELEHWAIGSFGPAPSDGEQGDDEGAAHEGG